jgi:hypothetical protein
MDDQWFYGQDGTQRGPIDLEALRALAASGQLRPHDLVWRQGMTDWLPATQVMPELFAPAPPIAPVPAPVAPAPVAPTPAAPAPPAAPYAPPAADPLGYQTPLYEANSQNGRAVTSLVLGILSIPTCLCPFVGIPLGIVAIVLGTGVKGGPNKGLAIGGIVCGGVGLLMNLPSTFSMLH